jgi:hypothetical protein
MVIDNFCLEESKEIGLMYAFDLVNLAHGIQSTNPAVLLDGIRNFSFDVLQKSAVRKSSERDAVIKIHDALFVDALSKTDFHREIFFPEQSGGITSKVFIETFWSELFFHLENLINLANRSLGHDEMFDLRKMLSEKGNADMVPGFLASMLSN